MLLLRSLLLIREDLLTTLATSHPFLLLLLQRLLATLQVLNKGGILTLSSEAVNFFFFSTTVY